MRKGLCRRPFIGILFIFILSYTAFAQANLSPRDVLEKNVQASGGKEKLSEIQNLSFKSGGTRYFASSSGELKIVTEGKESVITEVILVKGDKVQRNSFNIVSELTGTRKAVTQTLAKLFAGIFTLQKFEKDLKFQGLKTYGSKKLYHLTTTADSHKVDLFLAEDDFFLKRMVFQGMGQEGDKVEVNYDFAPFEETEGAKIPLSWFSSQVGTRGTLTEITEIKINQALEKDFFSKLDVNIGTVEAAAGHLKGNILDFNSSPNGLTITTNWTKIDIDKAGLKTGDELTFMNERANAGVIAGLVFYAAANEIPPPNELAKGARILSPAPRGGETYAIQFFGLTMSPPPSSLQILAPIEIVKK